MALFEKGQAALMCERLHTGETRPAPTLPHGMRCNHARLVAPTPEAAACSGAHTMCSVQLLAAGLARLSPHLHRRCDEQQSEVRAGGRACLRVFVHLQLRGHSDEQSIVPVARRVSHPFELAEVCMCARVRVHVHVCAHACMRVCVRA